jgi:hypothetical protein
MNMKKGIFALVTGIGLTAAILFSSCNKKDSIITPLRADTSIVAVNFSSSSPYAFFSFKNGTVANADSASNKWDFGLRLTTFLVNSNVSGPGNAGVIMQNGIFDNITMAPSTGYAYDTASNKLAIKDGSWYTYNITTHAFAPVPGKIFIFRTADGHYAKMEILEVNYEPFTGPMPSKIDYKIRFMYQANGSTGF